MAEKFIMENAEDTLAARANRRLRLYRITAVGLVVLLCGFAAWFYLTASVASKKALREAKDVRMAMKMLAIESYSNGKSLYDPKSANGLVEGGAERLAQLSEADGQVILTGWDAKESDAISFRYIKGNYVVNFQKTGDTGENGENGEAGYDGNVSWEVYLQLRLTGFGD